MLRFGNEERKRSGAKKNKDRNPRLLKSCDTQELLSDLHPRVISANRRNFQSS